MNLSLIDPFLLMRELPEALETTLKSGHSSCIRFNHHGDLLASGRLDGSIAIFDFDTYGVARKLRGHMRQVQSLSWSADDRYILSASLDWKAILWDLQTGEQLRTVRFEAPLFIAELQPSNHLFFVAALFEDQPVLVDITEEEPVIRTLPTAPKRPPAERDSDAEKQAAQDAKQTTTVTKFSPSGEYIFSGTNKGWLNIIDAKTCATLSSYRISSSIIILIRFTNSGKDLVVNSSDRIIRTFRLPDFSNPGFDFDTFHLGTPLRFQDLVNRLSWNYVCFSPSGEHVVASPYMNHSIYIWDRDSDRGSLVKILEAPDEISVVEWHPHKPCLAAVGLDEGRIYVWSMVTPQRWSALAPDFVEVEENVEYVEREDEFDIAPPEELHQRRLNREDESVDVLTLDVPLSHAHAGPAAFILPVLLDDAAAVNSDSEDDVVAVGAGQFRRKTPGRDWGAGAEGDAAAALTSGDERGGARQTVNGTGKPVNGSRRRAKAE